MRVLIVVILLLAGTGYANAQSEQPIPSARSHGEAEHNQPGNNSNASSSKADNSDSISFPVKIVNAAKNQEKVDAYAAEQKREAADDNATTLAWTAIILTSVQAVIFLLTLCFNIRAANAATKSANIAEQSLSDYDRPWLFIETIMVRRTDPPNIPNIWSVSFGWKNGGRFPAIVEECIIKIEDIDLMPSIPNYERGFPARCKHIIGVGDIAETTGLGPARNRTLTKNGQAIRFIVYGRMTYKELNGKIHHTGFAEEISAHLPASTPYRNKAYEYYD